MKKRLYSYLLLLLLSPILSAQDTSNVKLKVFIEGRIPDFNYLRSNMGFVDFVNDPHSSDVHVIVTRKGTAGGGNHYYITFNSMTVKTLDKFILNCVTASQDTDNIVRDKFTKSIKAGILIFLNEKQIYYQVDITDRNVSDKYQSSTSAGLDDWDHWVFNIGLNGEFDAEEQKQDLEYEAYVEANRITDIWRIRNEYEFGRDEAFIRTGKDESGDDVHAFNQEQEFSSTTAYSLTSHWSAGIFLDASQSTYRNMKLKANIHAAVEYNIFPWSEINRRTFTIAYFAGPGYFDYYEKTVLNKTTELLWRENLKIDLQQTEQWGELEVWFRAEHYLPDFKHYSIETGSEFSIRLAKGLFFEVKFEIEKINNQVYLQAADISEEDILLNTRQLPTSFEFSTEAGISYRFGSIYNNVINQRL